MQLAQSTIGWLLRADIARLPSVQLPSLLPRVRPLRDADWLLVDVRERYVSCHEWDGL